MPTGTLLYVRHSDDSWTRLGSVHTRWVRVQSQSPDGTWSDPLVPLHRAEVCALIEGEIKTGAQHLRGVAYKLTEVESQLTDADRARLAKLHDRDEEAE